MPVNLGDANDDRGNALPSGARFRYGENYVMFSDEDSDDTDGEELILREDYEILPLRRPRGRSGELSFRSETTLNRRVEQDGSGLEMGGEAYDCPSVWTLFPMPDEMSESERRREEFRNSRVFASLSSRYARMDDRSRRVSLFEERRLMALRMHLQRCFEASRSEQESSGRSRNVNAISPTRGQYVFPEHCSLLTPGVEFKGFQRCLRSRTYGEHPCSVDDWAVRCQIRRYDAAKGYVSGTMAAFVKNNKPVETFWEGEIIDNTLHTFWTNKWSASLRTDVEYWSKFPAFRELKDTVSEKSCSTVSDSSCSPVSLKEYPYIFMRWKEAYFITKTEQNLLTIQGFYYICMSRQTGAVMGYYYDPDCTPFQELELTPDRGGRPGFAFSFGEFI